MLTATVMYDNEWNGKLPCGEVVKYPSGYNYRWWNVRWPTRLTPYLNNDGRLVDCPSQAGVALNGGGAGGGGGITNYYMGEYGINPCLARANIPSARVCPSTPLYSEVRRYWDFGMSQGEISWVNAMHFKYVQNVHSGGVNIGYMDNSVQGTGSLGDLGLEPMSIWDLESPAPVH
jgi:prepilin-type processing-associated H-X9-DG protein